MKTTTVTSDMAHRPEQRASQPSEDSRAASANGSEYSPETGSSRSLPIIQDVDAQVAKPYGDGDRRMCRPSTLSCATCSNFLNGNGCDKETSDADADNAAPEINGAVHNPDGWREGDRASRPRALEERLPPRDHSLWSPMELRERLSWLQAGEELPPSPSSSASPSASPSASASPSPSLPLSDPPPLLRLPPYHPVLSLPLPPFSPSPCSSPLSLPPPPLSPSPPMSLSSPPRSPRSFRSPMSPGSAVSFPSLTPLSSPSSPLSSLSLSRSCSPLLMSPPPLSSTPFSLPLPPFSPSPCHSPLSLPPPPQSPTSSAASPVSWDDDDDGGDDLDYLSEEELMQINERHVDGG